MLIHENFIPELDLIKDDNIRNFATVALDLLPDYFADVAASSSGKYHPKFSQGVGGLVKHTKAATRILSDLFRTNIFDYLTEHEKDLMLTATLLHDGMKWGDDNAPLPHTVFGHPLLVANFVRTEPKLKLLLDSEDDLDIIADLVIAHMGKWNTNTHHDYELPIPISREQKILHMADYIASRTYLTFDLESKPPRRWEK